MFQKNFHKYLYLVFATLLFQACATPGKSRPPTTIMSPPVFGKGDDVVSTSPLRFIGVAKSGDFSGGFGLYATEKTLWEHDPGGILGDWFPLFWPIVIPMAAGDHERTFLSEEEIKQLKLRAEETLGYDSVQETLVQKVVQHGMEYGPTHLDVFDPDCAPDETCEDEFREKTGFDAILEIKVLRLGLIETWDLDHWDHLIQFVIEGWASLTRTSDKKVLRIRPFSVRGYSLTLKQWLDEAPVRWRPWTDEKKGNLAGWYEIHLDQLARMIVQAMIYQPDTVPVHDGTYCWIKPLEPNPLGTKTLISHPSPVYTTTPVLRWAPYLHSEEMDIANKEAPMKISNVTYDVKLWNLDTWRQIMEETGLSETEYRISEPLKRNTVYSWSIRANFLENGTPRRTGWSYRIRDKIPPGWWLKNKEEEEDVWPMEWNLTNAERKTIPKDFLESSMCISRNPQRVSDYRFKVLENNLP